MSLQDVLLDPKSGVTTALVRTYENERPLLGAGGELDWRFQGAITRFVKTGGIKGKKGECVLLPIRFKSRDYKILLIGCGPNPHPGKRAPIDEATGALIKKSLVALKYKSIGISKADFVIDSESEFIKDTGGFTLCITP